MGGAALGCVLAGGHGTRMGSDKAAVRLGPDTFLERTARALAEVTARVVVLGPSRPGWECWPDSVHARGPLAGIATALGRSPRERVLVLAVDHPFVLSSTLHRLLEIDRGLPVVPVDSSGTRQVTCAVYPTSIASEAVDEARAGGSIQTLIDRVSFTPVTPETWTSWGEDGRSWHSIDTPGELQAASMRYGLA